MIPHGVAGPDHGTVGGTVVFHFLFPVFVVPVEVDSSVRPRFFAFPNVDYYASCSSSVEVFG